LTIPIACQEIDLEGIIRRVNQKFCDLRGANAASVLGKHYSDFAHKSDREKIREELRLKLTGQAQLTSQAQIYVRADGRVVNLQVHETLLRDQDGNILGLRTSAVDVTEHTRKEEENWQTTAELRAVFQALPDVFLRLDLDGVVLDYRGGYGPERKNQEPVLTIHRDGNATVVDPTDERPTRKYRLSAAEVEALLREIVQESDFFNIDHNEISRAMAEEDRKTGSSMSMSNQRKAG
jgi:PAS domain S-box-containing protein